MEQQLPTAVVAAPNAAAAEAAGPRNAAMCASQNRQQLLRLAIQRQQQQEERQQQRPKQQQSQKARPHVRHAAELKKQEQEQAGHRGEGWLCFEQQHEQQLQQLHEQQLLKCVDLRIKGTTMQENSSTGALGSGSVSTANSGSESGSRSGSDDDEGRANQRYELRRKAVGGVAYKEYGCGEIPNMPVPQQHTQQILEVYKHQMQSRQQELEEHLHQRQWQHQQQPQRSLQHQVQQQLEVQKCHVQDFRQPFQQQGVQEDPSQEQQQEQEQEQEEPLGSYAEAVAVEKPLTPYTEEVDLGVDVGTAFLSEFLPQTTAVHSSAPPLFPLPFSLPADMASAAPGFYHVSSGNGHVGGPVRPARKKIVHSTLPPCPTVSTSRRSTATAKGVVRTDVGRMYRNSRITEVKSFSGTLEEYLVLRRQQAEREKAAAAAARSRNSCSRVATAVAHHELPERKYAGTLSNGSRRAASTGQHFVENTAATRSSRSSSRATSAGGWSRNAGDTGVKELNAAKEKGGHLQRRWKEHLQRLFAWRRNVGVKEQTHRTTHEKFQRLLSRQASQESQQDGSRRSRATSLNSAAGARETLPALNHPDAVNNDIPQIHLRMSGGDNSVPVFREEDKGVTDAEGAGRTVSNGSPRYRRREISRSQAEQDSLRGNSGLLRWDTHAFESAKSPDSQRQQGNKDVSVADKEERAGLETTKEDAGNTYEKDAEKKGARTKGRKLIPLEMRNGEIVWPTDRPVIPLNAWIFHNFSANEPLDPQNWVHLPNVGPAISPPAIPVPTAEQQSACPPARPPIPCSTAHLIHSSLFPEAPLTGPVKLPPVKLPVGYDVDPFSIYAEARPDIPTLTNVSPDASAPRVGATGETRRSRSLNGRLGGTPSTKPKSVYTQFVKQTHVRHRLTSFEGLVVRAEEEGRVLLVRSKEGQLRKLRRDECESIGFVCASAHPPEQLLTDAAHLHATRLLSATVGSATRLGRSISSASGSAGATPGALDPVRRGKAFFAASAASSASKLPFQPRADLRRKRPEREAHMLQYASTQDALLRAAPPRSASVPRHYHRQATRAFLDFFGLSRKSSAVLPTQSEEAYNDADKQRTQQLQLHQVPDLQEVLTLAQRHANATMHNTVALKNMATVPSIRAVDSQVTVEAIRLKKYMLEGKDEENLIPVFGEVASEENSKATSAAAPAVPAAAPHGKREIPHDATRLLLQKHEAREELKKREKELVEDEIIYAQDAPEATRASGIAPPTIVKETLVIPPKEDELFHYIWQAPGIVPPLTHCLNAVEKPRKTGTMKIARPGGSDVSSISTETPNVQHVNEEDRRGVGEETDRAVVGSALQLHTQAPAWFSDLKAQFRSQLLQRYQQTGSMEAAALAVSSGGYTPLVFTAAPSPAIQRKQAKVLRDELQQMDFAPMELSSPL